MVKWYIDEEKTMSQFKKSITKESMTINDTYKDIIISDDKDLLNDFFMNTDDVYNE